MSHNDEKLAIKAALNGEWGNARKINKAILKSSPTNIDALKRLACAEKELGNKDIAKKIYKKILSLSPDDTIAAKSLVKLDVTTKTSHHVTRLSAAKNFIEETGKTKTVSLLHTGSESVLTQIQSGEEVMLKTHGHRISVCTQSNEYLGKLPDDLSMHLKNLINKGNRYQALVKSVHEKTVKIFIREISKNPELDHIPSFTSDRVEYAKIN